MPTLREVIEAFRAGAITQERAILWITKNIESREGGGLADYDEALGLLTSPTDIPSPLDTIPPAVGDLTQVPYDPAFVTPGAGALGPPPVPSAFRDFEAGIPTAIIPGRTEYDQIQRLSSPPVGDLEAGRTVDTTSPELEYAQLPAYETSLRKLLAETTGRGQSFRDFLGGQFNLGASPFLRRGMESRFAPTNTFFNALAAMNQLPEALGTEAQALGMPMHFLNFAKGLGGSLPTQGTFRNIAQQVASAIGSGSLGGDFFTGDEGPGKQFDLALASVLPGISQAMQPGFARTAYRAFQDFQAQRPEQAGQFLPWFVERGYRF